MAPSFGFVIVLLLCSCSVATGLLSGGHNMVPTVKYQVDLDRMPKERWIPILEDLKGSVPLILQYYETIVRLCTPVLIRQSVPSPYLFDTYVVVPSSSSFLSVCMHLNEFI